MKYANQFFEETLRILLDRNENYGSSKPLFDNVAKRWSLTLNTEVSASEVILCLIDLKVARLHSNIKHHDSIVDIAGYAGILDEINNTQGD